MKKTSGGGEGRGEGGEMFLVGVVVSSGLSTEEYISYMYACIIIAGYYNVHVHVHVWYDYWCWLNCTVKHLFD